VFILFFSSKRAALVGHVVLNKNENNGGSLLPNIHEKDHGYDNSSTARSHSEPTSDAAKRRGKKKARS
jgi:hypothetical protein